MSNYKCSFCKQSGHNLRNCPEFEAVKSTPTPLQRYQVKKGLEVTMEFAHRHSSYRYKEEQKATETGTYLIKNLNGSIDSYYAYMTVEVVDPGKTTYAKGEELRLRCSEWTNFKTTGNQSKGSVNQKLEETKKLGIWDLTETILPASRLTLLYGPPGTGKTTAANFSGEPEKVCNITLTEETPAAEIRGHFVPKGSEFVWMDGPGLTAFKKGYRLVLNEIDKASGDALTFCHALLDDPGIARITLPYKDENDEPVTVLPHENFHVIATMNGDPEDLPDALRDRFAVRIFIDKVHPEAVKKLPKDLHKIAKKGISGDGNRSVSIRGWNAFAKLRDLVGEEAAAIAVFGDRAQTILNTIKISEAGGLKATAQAMQGISSAAASGKYSFFVVLVKDRATMPDTFWGSGMDNLSPESLAGTVKFSDLHQIESDVINTSKRHPSVNYEIWGMPLIGDILDFSTYEKVSLFKGGVEILG